MDSTHSHNKSSTKKQALLVLTAIGIVFGDIGTSPLYALRECFYGPHSIALTTDGLFGVLSLIFWSLMFVISFKYLVFVMRATNKGEGGVLALTALAIYRQNRRLPFGLRPLLLMGLFGAALLVGDGMITPAISVLSAVEGLKVATPALENWIVFITVIILIALFSIQKFGTAKIGTLFGPIVITWFAVIGGLGLISIVKSPEILEALNPYYALKFLYDHGTESLVILGSVFLAVTGGEALYADVGHFGRKAVTYGWYLCALPGLVLNYFGQGALLIRSPELVTNPFYHLAPDWFLYPLIAVATMAAVIASQALISGLFSLAQQCIQLGYCPRLQIIHTNEEHIGQIYVPAVNWAMMLGTIWLVLEFGSSSNLSGAYGMGISLIMVVTSTLAAVVAWSLWGWSTWKTYFVLAICMVFDLGFLAANSLKLDDGGWVSILIAAIVYFLMTTWKRGREILISRLRAQSYPFAQLQKDILLNPPARVRGTAIFLVGDTEMTPPALMHNLRHNKVLHEKIVFLTVVSKEIPHVPEKDRVEVTALAPTFFRVIAHYGFSDSPNIPALLNKCALNNFGFRLEDPTYFLGREILTTGAGRKGELSFWRKKVFSFMAKNATVARTFFKLPQQDVIEVGMEIEI
jgi:KUP system potassium uptake protein